MSYPTQGPVARFVIPGRHMLSKMEETPAVSSAPVVLAENAVDLASTRVLLVEDQVLIAMDAEEYLRSHGVMQVTIAPNAEAAIRQIQAEHPDEAPTVTEAMRSVPVVRKPYTEATLIEAITAALRLRAVR